MQKQLILIFSENYISQALCFVQLIEVFAEKSLRLVKMKWELSIFMKPYLPNVAPHFYIVNRGDSILSWIFGAYTAPINNELQDYKFSSTPLRRNSNFKNKKQLFFELFKRQIFSSTVTSNYPLLFVTTF